MTKRSTQKPVKSDDVPCTKAHLELVRQELKSDITSLSLNMNSKFQLLESKFQNVDSKFQNIESKFLHVESRFQQMDSRFQDMDSKFEKMTSVLFEMKALLEEQNSRNRVVLDGYAHLFDKSVSVESRIENLEKKVFGVSQK